MNSTKLLRKFTCCKCLNEIEKMTSDEPNPMYLCSICIQDDTYKHHIIVKVEGAPAGKVKGTKTPVKTRNTKKAFDK